MHYIGVNLLYKTIFIVNLRQIFMLFSCGLCYTGRVKIPRDLCRIVGRPIQQYIGMHALGEEEMLCCIQPLGGFVVVASEVSVESKSEVLTLAIVDDDHHPYTIDLAIPYWEVEVEGMFSAMPLECEGRSLNTLVELIKEQAKGAICIHRLAQREATNFYGAELVAALYDLKIPALLVTQYRDIDFSTSIRKWRDKIPVVLHPRE